MDPSLLDETEFWTLVQRHQRHFGVFPLFSGRLRAEARRQPSLLRLIFEVSAQSRNDLAAHNSREFFKRYVDKRFERFQHSADALRRLTDLAMKMFDENTEMVDAQDAMKTVDEPTLRRAADVGLVEQVHGQDGRPQVRFRESRVRNYLVISEGHRWLSKTADVLETDEVLLKITGGVQLEAMELLYLLADEAQKVVFDGDARKNARKALSIFDGAVRAVCPDLGDRFVPPLGKRAFVGYIDVRRGALFAVGFIPREGDDVFFWPRTRGIFEDRTAMFLGARKFSSRADGFLDEAKAAHFAFWETFKAELHGSGRKRPARRVKVCAHALGARDGACGRARAR